MRSNLPTPAPLATDEDCPECASWLTSVRWLITRRAVASLESPITTHGSGPVAEQELDGLLRDAGLEPFAVSKDTCLLVLGRGDWDEDALDQLLRDREGQELRVYSQEMLACYLATGEDPLEAEQEELAEFVAGHAGLEYLAVWGFPWPSTVVTFTGGGHHLELDRPETGWLSFLGYSVAAGGPSTRERRAVLGRAFAEPLPPRHFDSEYVREWGRRGSTDRLRKLAATVAALCRNAKRRNADLTDPITRWESDLAWLKEQYYDRRQRFPWPRTS